MCLLYLPICMNMRVVHHTQCDQLKSHVFITVYIWQSKTVKCSQVQIHWCYEQTVLYALTCVECLYHKQFKRLILNCMHCFDVKTKHISVVRFLFQFWHDTGTRGTNVNNCVINARLKLELSVKTPL